MTPDDPKHGTHRQGWRTVVGCQCAQCEKARAYRRRLHKQKQMGRPCRIPNELVAKHIRKLTADGWRQIDIARASGVGQATISEALSGVSKTMSVDNAAAIMGVTGEPNTYFVPAIGTLRRLQALVALGWTAREICTSAGLSPQFLPDLIGRNQPTVSADTAARAAAVYDRLSMTIPELTPARKRSRTIALKNGWVPPLAWDDIDNDAKPATGCTNGSCSNKVIFKGLCERHWRASLKTGVARHDDLDPVVVARILAGEYTLKATRAEKEAVVAAWPGSLAELSRLTGWHEGRYTTRRDGAA